MNIDVKHAIKTLRPSFSAVMKKWPARIAMEINWNVSFRRAALRAVETLRPLRDHPAVLPVQAQIAVIAISSLKGQLYPEQAGAVVLRKRNPSCDLV